MKQLRIRVILFLVWQIGFYLFTHFGVADYLSQYVFLYNLLITLVLLASPQLRRIHIAWLTIISILLFVSIKAILNNPVSGDSLRITIVECTAIFTTMVLLNWVQDGIQEFNKAVADISSIKPEQVVESAADGRGILYREVRRARNHQRPLSILTIGLDDKSINGSVNQFIQDAQKMVVKQLAINRVSRLLCEKLEDCDSVIRKDDHFIIALPETLPEDLPGLVERLRDNIADQLGIEIKIGTASLSSDSFTLDGLLEKAMNDMQRSTDAELLASSKQLLIKNKTG